MTSERRIITEIITLYKEFPCLWDNRQVLYTNKEAREQAWEILLEKYRQLEEDATLAEIKKRIENMRTCYRREHKKVLLSRRKGDEKEHTPLLWYYGMLAFLNDVMDFPNLDTSQTTDNGDNSVKIEYGDESSSSLRRLLVTSSEIKKRKLPSIYDQDHHEMDDEDGYGPEAIEETLLITDNEHNSPMVAENRLALTETEAFGTTVGLQLKELNSIQKVYAEKLISDVIYYARLNRLTFNSYLNVTEE